MESYEQTATLQELEGLAVDMLVFDEFMKYG
jgi:hypothetical protein